MLFLGISEDLFDAGAVVTDGRDVIFAANEERYTRRKNEGGFPHRSVAAALQWAGASLADVDAVAVSGIMTPPLPVRLFPRLHDWSYAVKRELRGSFLRGLADGVTFLTPMSHTASDGISRRWVRAVLPRVARRRLRGLRPGVPVSFADHHGCHAAAACALSGFTEALCVTADGMGDGLSLTVSRHREGAGLERLWSASSRDSFGLFYEALTEAFGFVPCRDEGKLTGLAALGDPARVGEPPPFARGADGRLRYTGPLGGRGVAWARRLLERHSREDVSAWAQSLLESFVLEITREWLARTGLRRLAVAGGVFANVKLNQRLHELEGVDGLFVLPNMGDGGLSLGAVALAGGLAPQRLKDVFFGESYEEAELERAMAAGGLAWERPENIAETVAGHVAGGRIVARFDGRMEWGPRALGNRSILAPAGDPAVHDRLNDHLKRSEFMPFAPAVADGELGRFVLGADKARHAAEFMTVCFSCAPKMGELYPSVVHADGTARAQCVRRDANPGFHAILEALGRRTGGAVVLNTSFNMHEEPIVRTPEEAVSAFLKARLDYLAMGPFLAGFPGGKR